MLFLVQCTCHDSMLASINRMHLCHLFEELAWSCFCVVSLGSNLANIKDGTMCSPSYQIELRETFQWDWSLLLQTIDIWNL
uniref:Uncharacterized protein n=1 Tax=Arundo donax TaxID=35708 RepID=A0A0A9FLE3_ARUDO